MKFRSQHLIILTSGVVMGLLLSVGSGVMATKETKSTSIPLEALRSFTDAYARIKNDYVEEVDDKTLLENAIRGMLTGLDPHSSYLNAAEFKDLQIGTTGEFGGLGIEVGMESGFVKVISPIDDTPAQRAGVQAGDLIIRLDEKPVKGMTLNDAVKIMRGKPGSVLTLTILRDGEDAPFKIAITRAVIQVKSVKSKLLGKDYGYVRITQFQTHTAESLVDAVKKLTKDAGGKLKGLVLDLRNNPGGVLGASVEVSDAFLESGLIVYTEGRVQDSRLRFSAKSGDVINGAPMVVLINGGSASASEIVSGALQDHGRAIIMGTKSFGKGSVQTIMPARGGSAVKLTTARYFTPKGRSIQAKGITPDIEVERAKISRKKKGSVASIKEKDLARHLSNGNKDDKKTKKSQDNKNNKKGNLAEKDYQLFEALNLLKGLSIARQISK
ncbi:MAG: S41 family peptidase [Gammaproteobacteria bacterium]|nr:S41 family peptidase [Gammaproteobacteria bacterium]